MSEPDKQADSGPDSGSEKIGRGPIFGRMEFAEILKIGVILSVLIAVLMLRKPCGDSVATFINSFEAPDAAPPKMEVIRLTPEEIEKRFPSVTRDAGPATPPDAGAK